VERTGFHAIYISGCLWVISQNIQGAMAFIPKHRGIYGLGGQRVNTIFLLLKVELNHKQLTEAYMSA
jgi:hypothetical protein